MPALNTITSDKLGRLIGTPSCPALIDLRPGRPDLLPGSLRRPAETVEDWSGAVSAPAVVICGNGAEASPGVAAYLRSRGVEAEVLEGGIKAWTAQGQPLVRESALPPRDRLGRTVWVTRARPKVDRIACPWLIRRFVDPEALILYVAPGEVARVAEQLQAAPFDVDGVFWSHRGALCSFDVMVEEFGLARLPGLGRLAEVVRGADTGHPEIAPQAAGLLAASLGLSRMFSSDEEQLAAGMLLYDAFFRWARDAWEETHTWESHLPKGRART
ncbi:MAG: chromate resistance protein ChrB domain-containing protein [Phenylobacterium sp.]|uniref:chromate resistance protein ChrB domain-containing protein n=1 Tax=Phenylobacterium sp. TaxID=1871053 RepID=UPI003919AA2A